MDSERESLTEAIKYGYWTKTGYRVSWELVDPLADVILAAGFTNKPNALDEVRAKAIEDVATELIDWEVIHGLADPSDETLVMHKIVDYLCRRAAEVRGKYDVGDEPPRKLGAGKRTA